MADAIDSHLDANRDLLVVRRECGPREARKDLALVRSTKVVGADLGDHLVVRHGHQVDDHGERADVTLLVVGGHVGHVRHAGGIRPGVGAEGGEEAQEGEHAGGVQKGHGHARDEDAALRRRPVDERRLQLRRVGGLRVGLLGELVDSQVGGKRTGVGLLNGCALVHGGHY